MIQSKPLPSRLSAADVASFERDGFLIVRGLATPDQVRRMRAETDGLHEAMVGNANPDIGISWEEEKAGRPPRIRQLMNSEKVCPSINEFIRSDAVLDIVETFIGPNILLSHSKLLMKAAHDGTVTPWHQDYSYWVRPDNKPLQLNCMVAIDESTKENGCTQYVPGTHKLGLIEHERKSGISFGVYLPGFFQERKDAIYAELKPGDCIFFGSLIIHGSAGNASSKDRRANTTAYEVAGNGAECAGLERLRGR